MQFGVMYANTGFGSSPDGAVALARAAESGGFATLWTVEHVVVPSGYQSRYPYSASGKMAGGAEEFDLPDPLMWAMWAAAHTERIRVATGVLILPQRNPLITAKAVATLDHLSGGRVTLGVGAGWLAEEFAALGVPFEHRGARLDEYIDVLRELWSPSSGDGKSSHHGRFVDFDDCIMRPRPVHGTVPIVVGGHSTAAARRAGQRGDGFFPASAAMEDLGQLFALAKDHASAANRDPAVLRLSAGGGRPGPELDSRVEALAELGVHEVVLPALPPDRLEALGHDLTSRFADL